jgi:hypothetical protein
MIGRRQALAQPGKGDWGRSRGPNTYLTTLCDLCRDRGKVAERREALERLALELADALAR